MNILRELIVIKVIRNNRSVKTKNQRKYLKYLIKCWEMKNKKHNGKWFDKIIT